MIERGPLWWTKKYAIPIATVVIAGSIVGAQNDIPTYPTLDFPLPEGGSLVTGSEDVQLRHLAMRLLSQGKDTSFEPTGEFTTEIFAQIRESTFQMELPVTGDYKNICTGWLVDKQAHTLTIITAFHCLPKDESFPVVRLWRPGLDPVGYWYPLTAIQQDEENDTAMLTFEIPSGVEIDAAPLAWEEEYVPTDSGETYLTVGFPYSFYMQGTGFNYYDILTFASVDHQAGSVFKNPRSPEMWAINNIGSNGLSGGPVLRINEYSNPVVVGIADEKEERLIETVFGAHLYVQPLHINKFFENKVCAK